MIYEFITPSDAITFIADDDAMAFAVTVFLSNGKAGCQREDGEHINTLLMLADEGTINSIIKEKLGVEKIYEFINKDKTAFIAALESFAYGSINERHGYDDACDAITEPEKLREFKAKHEDRNRTSISKWVQYAWDVASVMNYKLES